MAERNAYSPLSDETYELNSHFEEDPPPYTSAVPDNHYTNPFTSEPLTASYGASPVATSQQEDDIANARPILDAEAREEARKAEAQANKLGPRRRKGGWAGLRTEWKWVVYIAAACIIFVIVMVASISALDHHEWPSDSDSAKNNGTGNATTTRM